MKRSYLFPNVYKKVGLGLLLLSILMWIFWFDNEPNFLKVTVFSFISEEIFGPTKMFTFEKQNIADEITYIFTVISLLLIGFSREKEEDEFISKLRLDSLVWATYVNYIVILFSILFIYELAFLWLLGLNMFTILIAFILRYHWLLYKSKRGAHEE